MNTGRRRTLGLPAKARKDRDEDLVLFHDMLKCEKERTASLLQPVSDEFDPNPGNYRLYKIPSTKKGENDYDWLKTPPATPLFPSLEMENNAPNLIMQREIPILQPFIHSRFSANLQAPKETHEPKNPNPKSSVPSRAVTPGSKQNVSSTKTSNVKWNSASNEKKTNHANSDISKKSNSSSTKPTDQKQVPSNPSRPRSRGVSPLVRSRIPATLPGFSDETPPNLKTTSSTPSSRASSALRDRPGDQTATKTDTRSESVKSRRQSCSPSVTRGRKIEFRGESEQGKGKVVGNGNLVFGSRMVEKMMNARKSGVGEEREAKPDKKPIYQASANEKPGFGTTISKSSLDVAHKHVEIRRNPANFHHNNAAGPRKNSATASSVSSSGSSPLTTKEHESDSLENWKKSDYKNFPAKGKGRNRCGMC